MKFGKKIRHLLEIRGMSAAELSRKTGISKTLINDLINNNRTTTTTDTIEKISAILGVPVGYFWEEDAVTPFQLLSHMPEDVKDFILKEKNLDYAVLAKEWADKELDPDVVKKIINSYLMLIHETKYKV